MAGWHSLSGYLQYKSGNNALGRLMTRRKVWCILEESECRLLLFKCEEDVHKHCQPYVLIDLQGAAISLDLEHQNQFNILNDKREHVFTAENHESMMIWLLGLQAKRDLHCKKLIANQNVPDPSKTPSQQDYKVWGSQPSLYMTYDQHHADLQMSQSRSISSGLGCHGFKWEKYMKQKQGDSVDSGINAYKSRLETSRSYPMYSKFQSGLGPSKQMSYSHTMLSCDSDCDDVFGREQVMCRQRREPVSQNWKKVQLAVLGHVIRSHKLSSDAASLESNERRSNSSRSASSDSAIEKGEGTPQELAQRLAELEKELISTKCELAKVMNRQTCYQELLLQKDDTIKYMAEHGCDNNSNRSEEHRKPRSPVKRGKSEKEFEEKIRVLQNQNRFLNEEVKKLAKLRIQEHGKHQEQNIKLQSLEADIEKWKIDYVSVIQSSIRYPGDEGMEDVELCLYGGDKHKKRVQSLLEDARKINPRLPTYESLANNEVHVDCYGFKHVYTNTGLLLHYLCTELTHHYLMQAGVYEDHQKTWTTFMRQHGKEPMKLLTELKLLCRGGIPDRFRKQMWRHLVRFKIRDVVKEKGDYYYRNLCNMLPESPLAACYRKQVSLDLMRTMPSNVKFSTQGSKGIMNLQDVLLAFCIHNPTIGYCQGMNFIVAMSLIFMDPEDAFWTLVAVAESYFSPHYFDHSLIGAQSDQQILKDMVNEKLPALAKHLENIDIELSTITLNWFLAVFFDAVPFQTLLRIWDCFLLEGPKVLFRFSLAILKLHEKDILQKHDTMGIMKHLKACAKLTYDVDGLVKLAFEDLKPFPKRKDIISKQTCYLNALKEKYKKKELQRLAFAEREQMYMNMEAESGSFLGIECAVTVDDGNVWFCYGDQNIGRLSYVSCEQGTMCTADYKLDSRMMCMCAHGSDELLLGTISWMLVSVDIRTHEQTWQIQLHDAILSVCCLDDDDVSMMRVFTGLADGTVAVTEKPYCKPEPNVDVMYVPIGQAPVTCLMLLDEQLWCASGNTVAIIHAKTLDPMDTFLVSVNPYDHILSLVPSDYGIWISLRGSSILELWDPRTLNCRMLYDTRTDRYPQLRKEDDTYFNRARITSTLACGNTVWVGTGEGNLVIYEILECAQLMTPTELTPSIETTSSMSYIMRPEKYNENQVETLSTNLQRVYHKRWAVGMSQQSSLEVNADSCDEFRNLSGDETCHHERRAKTCTEQSRAKRAETFMRRRSSSENNLEHLQFTRYLEDGVVTGIQPDPKKQIDFRVKHLSYGCSDSDIESFEKMRNLSNCDVEQQMENGKAVEDEVEMALEAHARKESLTLIMDSNSSEYLRGRMSVGSRTGKDSESSRQSSAEQISECQSNSKRRQNGHAVKTDSYRSDDSGCDSRGWSRRNHTNLASSSHDDNPGSAKRKLFAKSEPKSVEEEDVFEAELEERARRESLVNIRLETDEHHEAESKEILLESEVSQNNVDSMDNDNEASMLMIKQTSLHSDGTISIFLNEDCSFDKEAQYRGEMSLTVFRSLGAGTCDDDYLSSSPCLSLTPVYSALGMSLDSNEESETRDVLPETITDYELQENIASPPELPGNRRSSIIDDIRTLCSDCRNLKTRCKDCAKLLQSQASLIMHERRSSLTAQSPADDKSFLKRMGNLNGIKSTGSEEEEMLEKKEDGGKESSLKTQCNNEVSAVNGEDNYDRDDRFEGNVELESATNVEEVNGINDVTNTNRKMERRGNGEQGSRDEIKEGSNCKISMNKNYTGKVTRESINKEIISKISREEMNCEFLRKISREEFKGEIPRRVSRDENYKGDLFPFKSEQVKMFPEENTVDKGDLTRQEKVGFWLSSLSQTISVEKEEMNVETMDHHVQDMNDEDVFYTVEDRRNIENNSAERPMSLNLAKSNNHCHGNRRSQNVKVMKGRGSIGSDGSSTQKSQKDIHLNKSDPGAQYRLDFSNVYVDTDIESEITTPTISVSKATHESVSDMQNMARYGGRDSRKNSLDLGSIQEKCSRLESEFKEEKIRRRSYGSAPTCCGTSDRQKIFEFLKTPSLASRQASLGLKIIDDDLEWTDMYNGHYTTPSPTSSSDRRFADFLRTPSISSKPSSLWSSYENISTPSQAPEPINNKLLRPVPQRHHQLSHSPSTASMGSDNELLYNVDLNLEAKMKISDKPIKCLLATSCKKESLILSFSGSFGDDEAVLKWRKQENEQLWTNEPILELCPKTKTAILPTYMRRRVSSTSSHHSHSSNGDIFFHPKK